jgi:hypothetical protein
VTASEPVSVTSRVRNGSARRFSGTAAQHVAQVADSRDCPAARRDACVAGLGFDEVVFRFYFGLFWREGIVCGDPHPDNCLPCPDGRVCLLDLSEDLIG